MINEIPQISARMKASTFIKAGSWPDLFKIYSTYGENDHLETVANSFLRSCSDSICCSVIATWLVEFIAPRYRFQSQWYIVCYIEGEIICWSVNNWKEERLIPWMSTLIPSTHIGWFSDTVIGLMILSEQQRDPCTCNQTAKNKASKSFLSCTARVSA